jgi:hypothetical protein
MPPKTAGAAKRRGKGKKTAAEEEAGDRAPHSAAADIPEHFVALRGHFQNAQKSASTHASGSEAMRRLLALYPDLLDEFFGCVSRILIVSKKEPSVERLVAFIAQTCCLPPPSPEAADLSEFALEYLVERSKAADKCVRQRACQLIAAVLDVKAQSNDPEISDALIEALEAAMVARLRDKSLSVRGHACAAARRLQFVEEEGYGQEGDIGLIFPELLRVMKSDSSPDVRRAALDAILITRTSLPEVIKRAKDTSANVRAAAYRVIAAKVDPAHLSCQQKVLLLEWGLGDRSESVIDACKAMLCGQWLLCVGGKATDVLRLLIPVQAEATVEKTAGALVTVGMEADLARRQGRVPPLGLSETQAKIVREATAPGAIRLASDLSPAAVLLACAQADALKADASSNSPSMDPSEREAALEVILPETADLCELVAKAAAIPDLAESPDELYTLKLLLKVGRHSDLSEEGGRQRLMTVLRTLLTDPMAPAELVEDAMRCLAAVNPIKSDFVRLVAEIMSDISDLNGDGIPEGLTEEEEEEEEEKRVLRQVRTLEICAVLLEHTERNISSDATLANLEQTILPAIGSPYGIARELGVSCLGKYCILSAEAAQRHTSLLLRVAEAEDEELSVRAMALQSLLDTSLIMGPEALGGESAAASIHALLSTTLGETGATEDDDSFSQALAAIAAEGTAKLIFAGRLNDAGLFGRLLAMYFVPGSPADPSTLSKLLDGRDESDDAGDIQNMTSLGSPVRLQQILSLSFPCLAVSCDPAQLRAAIACMLAELSSYARKQADNEDSMPAPMDKAARYACMLLARQAGGVPEASSSVPSGTAAEGESEAGEKEEGQGLSSSTAFVAMALIAEIYRTKDSVILRDHTCALSKALSSLPPPQGDLDATMLLLEASSHLASIIKDKASVKLLTKYATACEGRAEAESSEAAVTFITDARWEDICKSTGLALVRPSSSTQEEEQELDSKAPAGKSTAVSRMASTSRLLQLRASKRPLSRAGKKTSPKSYLEPKAGDSSSDESAGDDEEAFEEDEEDDDGEGDDHKA